MKDNIRRFTRRNDNGIKTKSTLLTQLEKMHKIQKSATAKMRIRGQNDWEKTLNDMAVSIGSIKQCKPRHYGKVWQDEKDQILNQAIRIYEDALKYCQYDSSPFMGNSSDKAGPSDRFINMSRMRWNTQEENWSYTHALNKSGDQYWRPQTKKPVKIIKQGTPEHDWAKLDYEHRRDYNGRGRRVVPNGGSKLTRDKGYFTDCGSNGRFGQRVIYGY